MATVLNNQNLALLNTFAIKAIAAEMLIIQKEDDLIDFFESNIYEEKNILVLGGGSNILFTGDYQGIVFLSLIKGIKMIEETHTHVLIEAAAGEEWDDFVEYAVSMNWGGIENLSLIPGTVGACPVQNIGAYGTEVKDVIEKVRYFNFTDQKFYELSNHDCKFSYRDSIFKNELSQKIFITSVTFRFTKNPSFNLSYGALHDELSEQKDINLRTIRNTIIKIRNSKLPDPKIFPNAGSFFKNPVITLEHFTKLQEKYSDMPHYSLENGFEKIPAAWLIEKCGWKGQRNGNVGVNQYQPLVLINYGNAKGNDILELSKKITDSVKEKFEILIETEVKIV